MQFIILELIIRFNFDVILLTFFNYLKTYKFHLNANITLSITKKTQPYIFIKKLNKICLSIILSYICDKE